MTNTRAGREHPTEDDPPVGTGKTYFLGIGIDQYQAWPRLHNAVRDVRAVRELLVDDFGLQAENAYTLYNDEATRAKVIQALEDMADRVAKTDSLLVYYAGHGHLNDRKRGYWVPADAPKDGISYYISNSTIRDYLGDINSLHTLLISDACFSGSLFVRGERSGDLAAHELAKLSSRWAICSGRHDEVVADGPRDGHSPFAESILDVLRKTERSVITTNFLFEQVRAQTRANYDQLPDGGPIQGVGHKRGQYIFKRNKKEAEVWAEAQQKNTAEAYRYYLSLFPTAEHAATANTRLNEISAQQAWTLLTQLPTDNIKGIENTLHRVRHFCQEFPESEHYSDALQLGQTLEHKRSFLQAYDSEFGLLELLSKGTPFKHEVEQRLAQVRGSIPQKSKPEPQPKAPPADPKKTTQQRSNIAQSGPARPPNTPSSPGAKKRSQGPRAGWIIGSVSVLLTMVIIWVAARSFDHTNSLKKKAATVRHELYQAMKDRDTALVLQLKQEYQDLPDELTEDLPINRAEQWMTRFRDSLSRVQSSGSSAEENQAGKNDSTERYYVFSDTYRTREKAEAALKNMRSAGLNTAKIVERRRNTYTILVATLEDELTAHKLVNQLEEKGFAGYVDK